MRALLVDVGNTSIKIGVAEKHEVLCSFTLPTDVAQGSDLLGLRLVQLLEQVQRERPTTSCDDELVECFISSVVPGMNPLLRQACVRYLQLEANFAHIDVPVPLENHYERPLEVGADRLMAAYAARKLFPDAKSVISVDFGTATTFDCVTDNAYLGGLICPGVMSSLGALSTRTAQLPRIPLTVEDAVLTVGRSTVTSLNQGFLFGFSAMSEGVCARLQDSLPGPCPVVATGGFASSVARVSRCFDVVQPDLVLDGLRLLWQETQA